MNVMARSGGSDRRVLMVPSTAPDEGANRDLGAGRATAWAEPLQRLALALVRAVSLEDVAAAVVAYGTIAAGARWAHVVLLDDGGTVAVSRLGGPAVPSCQLEALGRDATVPWNDALREGRVLAFPSTEALHRAYPSLEPALAVPTAGPVVTTPLVTVGEGRGAVTFGFDASPSGDGAATVDAPLDEIAALAGHAAARAAFYAGEHQSAELVQRAYMPVRLSPRAGLSFATRYLPAGEPVAVGGDWYDVLPLPGPVVGVVMGDVAGHGLQAAIVMASLRAALRAFATVEASPARILTRLNDYTCLYKPDAFATAFVAVFEPGGERLRYARAGHPPALVVAGDGTTEVLSDGLGPPLGLPGATYEAGEHVFPAGASLVAYTDGLIERRHESIEAGLADLVGAAPAGAGAGPERLADRLVVELLAGRDLADDAALLVATRQDTGS
jgi:Stage II sporulation protein E (SpoIIE)